MFIPSLQIRVLNLPCKDPTQPSAQTPTNLGSCRWWCFSHMADEIPGMEGLSDLICFKMFERIYILSHMLHVQYIYLFTTKIDQM